jgi:hypothetical protein
VGQGRPGSIGLDEQGIQAGPVGVAGLGQGYVQFIEQAGETLADVEVAGSAGQRGYGVGVGL